MLYNYTNTHYITIQINNLYFYQIKFVNYNYYFDITDYDD